ncbi:MAG: TonB-dependent receptor plug domain-containing protein, partial [Muribaculaceae bacterium]|nr:TonB-dependent receptor plug domain-containing protein [Muribaculaceae bacterium]
MLKGFILILVAGLLPLHAAASSEISEASESYESFGVDTLPDITLEGVTVTAVKQGSDLSNQGIATTSLSRPALEANNMLSAKAVTSAIPNVFIPDYGSRMTSTIYVRGIGARIDQPAVGLTIDNIPILCKENYDFDLLDIARFEMLHGPQSTLFGRNTMGGVMNVFTLSPFNYQGTRILFEGASHMSFKAGLSHY